MKILIVAATETELTQTIEYFNLQAGQFTATPKFDLLITGVGMTATAFALGQRLNTTYQLVINVGIAGSFDQNIPLGNLVEVVTDIFAELGAEDHDHFITITELGFGENTYHSTGNGSLALPKVNAITVNKVHGNQNSISSIVDQFHPQVESMEGAAVFYACSIAQIPCIQVRSISNYVTPRSKADWQIGLAIKNLNAWLITFMDQL